MKRHTLLPILFFSDENVVESSIKLRFPMPGVQHRVTLREGAPGARRQQHPKANQIRTVEVPSKISLPHKLAAG